MKILCEFLNVLVNPLIYLLAIAEFVLMWVSIWTLTGFRKRISDLNRDNIRKIKLSKTKGKREVSKTVERVESRNWDDFERFQRDYQKGSVWYSAFSLIIQLFTLLGILGTVVGLYIAMNNGEDLYRGVGLALTTTINGILFAVIFKLVDIGITAMLLNFIDDGIDIFVDSYKADSDDATRNAMLESGRETAGEKEGEAEGKTGTEAGSKQGSEPVKANDNESESKETVTEEKESEIQNEKKTQE